MTLPEVIQAIQPQLAKDQSVHAMWLEGSYATGKSRPDSDIDVWLDVDDDSFEGTFQQFKSALEGLDLLRNYEVLNFYSTEPVLAKAKFYLVDKPDDQRIELDLQPHSRKFVFSHGEHAIKALFDKDQTIRWRT